MTTTTVGIVDDHQLFLKSLSLMIETFSYFEVSVQALNGQELLGKLGHLVNQPEIMLIDVNMPLLNGVETTKILNDKYPSMLLVALSMNDKEETIIEMFRAGCCAYLLKDTHPSEFEKVLRQISLKGYYNSDLPTLNFKKILARSDSQKEPLVTPKEKIFLNYVCSELTYKQIAQKMNLSERTIDGYREHLFEKFKVQSRVGLCLEILRKGIVNL